jgi:hypothetical protein
MALELYGGLDLSCVAENTMVAKQFFAAELSGAGLQVDVPDNAGDLVLGVIQNKAPAGAAVTVRVQGVTKWVSDGSGTPITVGARVGTDAVGKCVIKTANNAKAAGIALSASSADGTIIDVLLTPGTTIGA